MSRSWVLVGMMGAGKSSVGRRLAEISSREFIDTDSLLQHKLGRTIPQLFSLYGEETFRQHEHAILTGLQPGSTVVSTGGGIVGRPENWIEMRRLGTVIYLQASLETLIKRLAVSKKKRPLLEVDNWENRVEEILSKRVDLYVQADVVVDLDSIGIEDAAEHILAVLSEMGKSND